MFHQAVLHRVTFCGVTGCMFTLAPESQSNRLTKLIPKSIEDGISVDLSHR
jgi:hypothetical protein